MVQEEKITVQTQGKSKSKQRKGLYIAFVCCFATIFVYQLLTPMLSDDLNYQRIVNEASGFGDLFRQEFEHYTGWTGRSVVHMTMRVLMRINSPVFTRIFLSLAFTALTVFMYYLSTNYTGDGGVRKTTTYLLCTLLVWIFGVEFAETVLWMTGACNYLMGTTIILADMVFYERMLHQNHTGVGGMCKTGLPLEGAQGPGDLGSARTGAERRQLSAKPTDEVDAPVPAIKFLVAILLGILAGWCNENTSGGLILFVIYLLWRTKYQEKRKIPTALIAGFIANLTGLAFMILAPGNYARASLKQDEGNFIIRIASRFFSVTGSIYELFFPLLVAAVILGVLLYYKGITFKKAQRFYLFLFLFTATSYSLILAPDAQERAFFGAGIFLFIALATGNDILCNNDLPLEGKVSPKETDEVDRFPLLWLKPAITYILLLYMFFTYIDSGAKLAWIYREETERMEYLAAQRETGAYESGAPLLRPQFETKYSVAYKMDINEDWTYWINQQYAQYYGFDLIWGVPREEWTEY